MSARYCALNVVGEKGNASAAVRFLELWASGSEEKAVVEELRQRAASNSLHGRVIHGRREEDFGLLSTNRHNGEQWKRLSWVFGPQAPPSFVGKSARDVCINLGFGHAWLDAKLVDGVLFKMAVFPAEAVGDFCCVQATWDNLERLVMRAYPEVAAKVCQHLPEIRATPFSEIERQAGYSMLEVNLKGREVDPRYMSTARLQASEGSLVQVRQFLWDEIGVRDLYVGDGMSMEDDGSRGVPEYLAENWALKDIPGCVLCDLSF